MDHDAAVNVILMHSTGREDVPLNEALYPEGFLGCLRPFSELREENFLQVMDAIIALGPHVAGKRQWDVRLVEALWGLVVTARNWGLDPLGADQSKAIHPQTPGRDARGAAAEGGTSGKRRRRINSPSPANFGQADGDHPHFPSGRMAKLSPSTLIFTCCSRPKYLCDSRRVWPAE